MGTYFASSAKAMMPATMGAETEVPVWPSVQRWRRSVVTWAGAASSRVRGCSGHCPWAGVTLAPGMEEVLCRHTLATEASACLAPPAATW